MPKKVKGAYCPKCKKRWWWNWGQDVYEKDIHKPKCGGFCKQVELANTDPKTFCSSDGEPIVLTANFCDCGQLLSVNILHQDIGSTEFNVPEWASIDWELSEYASPHC